MPLVSTSQDTSAFVYSDVNVGYRGSNNFGLMVYDITAINEQIVNIFSTRIGERIFEPTFGSLITGYLFDPADPITAYKIRMEMISALSKWMPRIILDLNNTKVVASSSRGYDVVIMYSVRGLSVSASLGLQLPAGSIA